MIPSAKGSVLIVEDDKALGESMSALLESLGYALTRARSRMSSLTVLLENQFDVVLLDLNLGGGDHEGLRVVEAARKAGIEVPPIVIVSGQTLASIKRAAAALNTDFYIQKPVTAESMTSVIEDALKAR